MSKKGKEKNDENMTEIPLLEEVNELLHKERNLMNLKLIEQHVEAKEWKEKYETLVEKISGDALNQEKIKAYEVAAEVSTAPRLNTWRNNIEKQLYLLPSSNMPWYLDVSNVSLGVNDIHRILMYPKTNNYKLITVFNFHNCEIDDSCAQLFPHMLRYPNIAAIDFSCNNVSETFHKSLLGAVETRRLKLQYLLLHGNMQLANFPLENFLHHLSSSVWGLTVSLTDVYSTATSHKSKQSPESKSKTSSTAPKHTARFLKHLNHILDPTKGQENSLAASTTRAKSQRQKPAKNNEFIQPHRGAGGMQATPLAICVLGLMHSILSEDSLSQLETTLKLSVSSLTDLDLSYSFISLKGAKLMGKFLRHRSCQLIRLNLMGNAVGDVGVSSFICPALKITKTLTYLDLKSNNLMDSGLLSLANALENKTTFRKLIVEGNPISLSAVMRARDYVIKSGAPELCIDFGTAFLEPFPLNESKLPQILGTTTEDDCLEPIFSKPGQVSTILEPTSSEVELYSVESRYIKFVACEKNNEEDTKILLENKIAEASDGEVRLVWFLNVSNFQEGYQHLTTFSSLPKAIISWEVRSCSYANQVTTLCSKALLPDAFLPGGSFVTCTATVPKPPFRTKLEVWVKVVNPKSVNIPSKTLCVKSFGLKIYAVPSLFDTSHVIHGGDAARWSSVMNSLLGSWNRMGSNDVTTNDIPDGYTIARTVRWVGQHAIDLRVCFRTKLSAVYSVVCGVDDNHRQQQSSVNSTWHTTNGSRVGYSWCLYRNRFGDDLEIVASGDVTQGGGTGGGDEGKESSASEDLLQPWLWTDNEVRVNEAATNECFILCVSVQSDPPVHNFEEKCNVQVKDCAFYVVGENFELQKEVIYEYQSNPHNIM